MFYENDGQLSLIEPPPYSNEWKWSYADYPKSNGINVFSCFACGGVAQWDIN